MSTGTLRRGHPTSDLGGSMDQTHKGADSGAPIWTSQTVAPKYRSARAIESWIHHYREISEKSIVFSHLDAPA